MAGSLTDKVMRVGQEGTLTSLQSPGKALAASSITIGSGSNWESTTGFIIAIRTVDSSGVEVADTYTEWIATYSGSGTSVTINPIPVTGSDQVYTAGVNTQVFLPVSAKRENLLADHILTQHNQDGTHAAVTATSVTTSGAVLTTPKVITSINDTNGNEEIRVTATASAVNDVTVTNAITGNAPAIAASGDDTNVSLNLASKGTGGIQFNGTDVSGAWTAFTPTITAGTGTITTSSAIGRYKQVGKVINWKADITITTVGTGSGACLFTLPVTAQSSAGYVGNGREDGVSGKQLQIKLNSASQGAAVNYDGTSPLASGSILRLSGSYEAA